MIVVIDTNIWKSNLYLQSPASAALKLFLVKKAARVGLPEVIKLEVQQHLRSDLVKARDSVRDGHRRLLAVFGRLREVVLPSDAEIEQIADSFFDRFGLNFIEAPFTYESAKGAFMRIIKKVPPCEKSQQFKDAVIWEDCKVFARTEDVVVLTDDREFCEKEDQKLGLSEELSAELVGLAHSIRLVCSLSELLQELSEQVDLDRDRFVSAIEAALKRDMEEALLRDQLSVRSRTLTYEAFATERPGVLFLNFILTSACEGQVPGAVSDASLIVDGDCFYDITSCEYSAVRGHGLQVRFTDAAGQSVDKKNVYARGDIFLGHRETVHTARHKLQ